jgi:hypothetical protein
MPTISENIGSGIMWTDEIILRLKAYVDAGHWYVVTYCGNKVYGVEPRRPEYKSEGWAGLYMSAYDDALPDPIPLDSINPKEIRVEQLVPDFDWLSHDPMLPTGWDK